MTELDTADRPQTPRPTPAGLWPALWHLLAAIFSFKAAAAAFAYDGRFLFGALALAAVLVAIALNRWQAAVRRGDETAFARLPRNTLVSLCLAAWFGAAALLLAVLERDSRGIALVGDMLLRKEGALDMAVTLALAFLAAALASHLLHTRRPLSNARHGAFLTLAALATLLLGPTLIVERARGTMGPPPLYIKHSPRSMLAGGDDAILRAETVRGGDQEPQTIVCVAQRSRSFLMFGVRSGWAAQSEDYFADVAELEQRVAQCDMETREALDSGTAIETALYSNQLERFFDRVDVAPDTYRTHVLAADIERLPEPLRTALANLVPTSRRWNYTAFDVALAAGDTKAIQATVPAPQEVLPHQRQALFALGMSETLDSVPGETIESLAEKHSDAYRAEMALATRFGSIEMMRTALFSLLTSSPGSGYSEFRGGYSEFDYLMANRHCDVAYAKFLHARELQPATLHILHLLSIMGHAQYPGIDRGTYGAPFRHADESLGLPDESRLEHCVELAAFYGATVRDFNETHADLVEVQGYESRQLTTYDAVYRLASDAVFQWWSRDVEKRLHNGRARDTRVHGDPALVVRAAVEVLKPQPASYEQYCAWANTAHTWLSLVSESQPAMVSAMQTLPEQWRNSPRVYQAPEASCPLEALSTITDEYQHPREAAKYLNVALRNAGIPCQGRYLEKERRARFTCDIDPAPWPTEAH